MPTDRRFRSGLAVAVGLLVAMAARDVHADPLRVRMALQSHAGIADDVLSLAFEEASRVWAPYDVVLERSDRDSRRILKGPYDSSASDEATSLILQFDDGPSRDEDGDSLGATRSAGRGRPIPVITIHYGALRRFVAADRSITADHERTAVVARAVGRAMAHEIGHVLLHWAYHAPTGLMRAQFGASTLTDLSSDGFLLTAQDRARLEIVRRAESAETRRVPISALE